MIEAEQQNRTASNSNILIDGTQANNKRLYAAASRLRDFAARLQGNAGVDKATSGRDIPSPPTAIKQHFQARMEDLNNTQGAHLSDLEAILNSLESFI